MECYWNQIRPGSSFPVLLRGHFLPIASWRNGRKWARPYVFSLKWGNVQTQASVNWPMQCRPTENGSSMNITASRSHIWTLSWWWNFRRFPWQFMVSSQLQYRPILNMFFFQSWICYRLWTGLVFQGFIRWASIGFGIRVREQGRFVLNVRKWFQHDAYIYFCVFQNTRLLIRHINLQFHIEQGSCLICNTLLLDQHSCITYCIGFGGSCPSSTRVQYICTCVAVVFFTRLMCCLLYCRKCLKCHVKMWNK